MYRSPSSMKVVFFFFISSFGHLCCECGSFLPNDPFYFTNETGYLTCALDKLSSLVNASNLYITLNDMEVDSSFLSIVNETAVSFSKEMAREDDGKYTCRIRGLTGMPGVVGTTYLRVDDPLEPINDIQCMWYNWKDKLVCTWTLPPYRYMDNIWVDLFWYNGVSDHCLLKENKTMYTWDGTFTLDTVSWTFQLTVINTAHNNVTAMGKSITKTVADNVKPNAVESFDLHFTNTSTCLLLTWVFDTFISSSRQKYYRVQYSPVADPSQNQTRWSEAENMTVCELTPYTLYKFTIAVHPDRAAVNGYWSDPVTKETRTDQDVPSRSPDIVGCAMSSDVNSQGGPNSTRSYTVFWKSLHKEDRNGVITKYRIAYTDTGAHHTGSIVQNGSSSSVNIKLYRNTLYNISISAATVKGYSTHNSSLIINTTGTTPATVMVERNASLYNVSWTVPGSVDFLTSYTVVYCTMFGSEQECAGELQKVNVPDSQTRHQTLSLTSDTMYLFGVSVVRAGVASAVKLESCIYVVTERPSQPEFSVDDSIGENSLRIEWDPITCNNKQPFVTSFTIAWCQAREILDQCVSQNQSIVIPSTSKRVFIITNLEKDVQYGVVMSSSSVSRTGLPTVMKYGTPTNNDITTKAIVGITLGVIFVCVFYIAGIICCCRMTQNKILKINKPYPIDVPQLEKEIDCRKDSGQRNSGKSNGDQTKRQNSRDSGKGGSLSTEPDTPDRLDPVPEDDTSPYSDLPVALDYTDKIRVTSGIGSSDPSSSNNPYSVVLTSKPDSKTSTEDDASQSSVKREERTVSDSFSEVHVNPTEVTVMFVGAPIPSRDSVDRNDGYTDHNQIACGPDSEVVQPDTLSTDDVSLSQQPSTPHGNPSGPLDNTMVDTTSCLTDPVEPGHYQSVVSSKETSAGAGINCDTSEDDGYKTHNSIGIAYSKYK